MSNSHASTEQTIIRVSPLAASHFYYGVRIATGSEVGAGTPDSDVYVTLVGSKARTGQLALVSGWWSRPLASKTYVDLLIESNLDMGEVLVVFLGNPKNWLFSVGSPWYVDFVDVIDQQSKEKVVFPCYHWINDGDAISFTSKTSKLN